MHLRCLLALSQLVTAGHDNELGGGCQKRNTGGPKFHIRSIA